MQNKSIEAIARIAGCTLAGREHVTEMTDLLKNNPDRFNELLSAYDQVIIQFNNSSFDDIPLEFTNARKLKTLLGTIQLRTVAEMDASDSPYNLRSTLKQMKAMMLRGETTKEEPWLRFHTTNTDPEALVSGGIIHTMEEYYLAHANLPDDVQRGMIELAIDEILSLNPDNPL